MYRLQRFFICVLVLLMFMGQRNYFLSASLGSSPSMLAPFMSSPVVAARTDTLFRNLEGLYPELHPMLRELSLNLAPDKHLRLEAALREHAKSAGQGISGDEWGRLMRKNKVWSDLYEILHRSELPDDEISDIGRIAVLLDALFADDEDFAGVIGHTVQVACMAGDFLNAAGHLSGLLYADLVDDGRIRRQIADMFDLAVSIKYMKMTQTLMSYIYYYYRDYVDEVREDIIPDVLRAALLHDLGKFFIPSDVLNFPGKHSAQQRTVMQMHPIFSYIICRAAGYSDEISHIVLHHHEQPFGDGYPDGLIDRAVTWQIRLVSAVDVFSALDEQRPYKEGLPWHTCLSIMRQMALAGVLDKNVVELFEDRLNGKVVESCA